MTIHRNDFVFSSQTPVSERLNTLRDSLPEAFDSEGALDFNRLKALLGGDALPETTLQLTWAGKSQAMKGAQGPLPFALRPDVSASEGFENTSNVFVEADNLAALRLMRNAYFGQVKMIYIDPPYNTGNEFVYNDDFRDPKSAYLCQTGRVDEHGRQTRENSKEANSAVASGRKHSGWLNFMYPRLALAKDLLRQDGAILVACDDHELANLRVIMNEIFREENFVATFVWQGGRKNDAKYVSTGHDYMVCFARDMATLKAQGIRWRVRKEGLDAVYAAVDKIVRECSPDWDLATDRLKAWFKALPADHPAQSVKHYNRIDGHADRGHVFFPDNLSWPGGGGPTYDVRHPVTGCIVKHPSGGWRYPDPDVFASMVADDRILFGEDETKVPNFKRYLRDTETWSMDSVFYQDRRAASKRLSTLMDGPLFDFPKDETVIARVIEAITDDGDIVMDFFGGSGTTAHAVWLQNAKDGLRRQFVLATLPEQTAPKSAARKAGYAHISDITIERLHRSYQKVRDDNPGHSDDYGFRVFRLAPIEEIWPVREASEDALLASLKRYEEAGEIDVEAVLWRDVLAAGFPLDARVEERESGVFLVTAGARAAWFTIGISGITAALATSGAQEQDQVFCCDAGVPDTEIANASMLYQLKLTR